MAGKQFVISAKIKTDFQSVQKELEKVRSTILQITTAMPNVGAATQKQFVEMATEMDKLKDRAAEGIESGSFADPTHTKQYLDDLRKQEDAMHKMTQSIVLKNAASDKDKEAIKAITAEIDKKTDALEEQERQLEAIRSKTKEISQLEKDVGKKLGISPESLRDPDKLKAEISKRETSSGQPKDAQAKKDIALLNQILELRRQIEKESGDILEQEAKISANIKLQSNDIESQKNLRRSMLIDTIENNKKLTKEQKKQLVDLIKQGATLSEIEKKVKGVTYKQQTDEIKKATKANTAFNASLGKGKKGFLQNITAATLYYTALRTIRRVISSVIKVMTELDKSFTEIAMVSNLNRKESWAMIDGYQRLATQVGTTTSEIAKLGVFFARQGRSAADAFELTKVAAMAAKVASIDATESANFLTSAINGFGLAVDQAMEISDKFAALGANSASSYEEMAIALSKVAPSAKVAGINIDQMLGFLAKGIETTREAPENIGTAFKTVFARMTQLRDFGKTLEEGVAVNTVEEALATAGIALRDSQGTFRDMGAVLTELGYKFEGLTRNQQTYIATALAGTRQQSRLLAVLQNFDRTMELVDVSLDASGATMAQHAEYAGGMEAASARLATAWQRVITNFIEADVVISIVKILTGAMNILAKSVENIIPIIMMAVAAILMFSREAVVAAISSNIKLIASLYAGAKAMAVKGMANIKAAIALKMYGTAAWYALGPIGLLIGSVLLLYQVFKDSGQAAEKSAEKINQLTVDLYNLNKESKDFGGLVDKFKKLEGQTFKTSDELKEMEDTLSKIAEYGGSKYDFVLAGQLDMEAVQLFMEAKEMEELGKLDELRKAGAKTINRVQGGGVPIALGERTAVVELLASTMYSDYDNLEKEEQKLIKSMITKNLDYYVEQFNEAAFQERANPYHEHHGAPSLEFVFPGAKEFDKQVLSMANIYSKMLKGFATKAEQETFFDTYFKMGPEKQIQLRQMYGSLLTNVLDFGQTTIDNFIDKGFNISQITAMANNLEKALTGIFVDITYEEQHPLDGSAPVILSKIDRADEIAKFYVETLATLDPKNINSVNTAISMTIQQMTMLGASSGEAAKMTKVLVDTLTDPMAFNTGLNSIRSASSSIKTLMQATKDMSEGSIPDNLENLVQAYPALASKILDGTLTISEAYKAAADDLTNTLNAKLNDLTAQYNMATEAEKERIKAQIDVLQYYRDRPELLMNESSDSVIAKQIKKMEDRYKTEIDFIKSLNDAKKKEIDLMKQKLDMNKSMVDVDRQLAALSKDTSYGAQARLRDLRDEQRNQAIEREKFVMDLITEQAVSELEQASKEAVLNINRNLQFIADQYRNGSGDTRSDSLPGTTGENRGT